MSSCYCNTRLCLGTATGGRGRKGAFLCCFLLELKLVTILISFCLHRTDLVVSFPLASTSSSRCHCHSVVLVAGEEKSLPCVQAGIRLVSAEQILLPSAPWSPCLPLASPAWIWHSLSGTCFLHSEYRKCQPGSSCS